MTNRDALISYVAVVALLIGLFGAFGAGVSLGRRQASSNLAEVCKIDTVYLYKTSSGQLPQYRFENFKSWAFFTETQTDTVRELVPYAVHDTVYVPITQRYYEELDGRLRLWVSGYRPTLDKWELDEVTMDVTRTTRKRWGVSAGIGPAVIWSPFHGMDAGVGVFGGVTYTF